MDTTQIVLITLLGVVGIVALVSLLDRMASLEDDLWIELVIMFLVAFFIYLVAR